VKQPLNVSPERAVLILLHSIAGAENMRRSQNLAKTPHKRMKFIHSLILTEINVLSHEIDNKTNSKSDLLRELKGKAECLRSLHVLSTTALNHSSSSS
jgi:hypothetical protein